MLCDKIIKSHIFYNSVCMAIVYVKHRDLMVISTVCVKWYIITKRNISLSFYKMIYLNNDYKDIN